MISVPRVFIISAESSDFAALGEAIEQMGLPFKRVIGRYHGEREDSFLVVAPFGDGAPECARLKALGIAYGQETILERHPDGCTQLHYLSDGRDVYLGQWCELTGSEAYSGDFTFDPDSCTYWGVR